MDLKRILNILAFAGVVAVNWLADHLPLNGQTTGEISDKFPILFTPPRYVFAIWGLIYLFLLFFVIYQILPKQDDNIYIERIGNAFILSCLFNIAWIFSWHYEYFLLSIILMAALLITLVFIYSKLEIASNRLFFGEKAFINFPFSIYLGWITIATIGNLSVFLYSLGYENLFIGQELWTEIALILGGIIALLVLFLRKDVFYSLVFVWAYVGIGMKNLTITYISYIAFGMSGIIVLSILFMLIRKHSRRRKYMFY